jgi:hypothetical protein
MNAEIIQTWHSSWLNLKLQVKKRKESDSIVVHFPNLSTSPIDTTASVRYSEGNIKV